MSLRNLVLFICATLALGVAATGDAALFFADRFDYADGDLTVVAGSGDNVSGGRWVPFSGTGNPPSIEVVNDQARLLMPGSEDAERSVPNAGTEFQTAGETWYASALVTVNDQRPSLATPITKEYFLLMKDTSTGNLRSRLYVDNPTVAGTAGYRFAIGASSGAGNAVNFPTDLTFGEQHKVVISYEHNTGFAQLWVDPVNQLSPSVIGVLGASPTTFISALGLRQAFFAAGVANTEILVDGVRFGDTFADVVRIPEPATVSLAVMSIAGMVVARRRRA
jgi:hypothetical protein